MSQEEVDATSVDVSSLSEYFTATQLTQLQTLYTSKGTSQSQITTEPNLTKDQRTYIHKTIRQLFNSKLESQVTPTNAIRINYVTSQPRRTDSKWSQGEYCHFTCKKNNRDTMTTASLLAKWLKCHPRVIGYAGTKDRRAITTQRMSAHKMKAERLAALNKIANPMGIWLGDFSYSKVPVKLGDLKGNEFIITLREVPLSVNLSEIEKAMESLRENGFINYYGMQRFGTSLVSTHTVGALLLNGQWKEACEAILDVKAGGMNDSLEARELYARGDIAGALDKMPRTCIAERSILGVLKQDSKHYSGALQAVIPLIMYLNADSKEFEIDVCPCLSIPYLECCCIS
jgi:tRNA pseudouridine13 synthase